jgi:hypothetical protein
VIVQFVDVINKDNGANTITEFSSYRFFHDRAASISSLIDQPVLGGQLNNQREIYILHFAVSSVTQSKIIRLRILNGNILNHTRGVKREWIDEVSVDIKKNTGKPLFICFDCNPVYGAWFLAFGNEDGWEKCPVNFDYFALIRASKPLDDNTMELPRFIVSPVFAYEPIASDFRGSVGQPYGRTIRQLKTLSVNFTRVKIDLIDEYYNRVSVTEPHFIVPYPEDVENLPPVWGTLTQAPKFTKRDENGWYWNLSLTWKEAY